MPELNIAIDAMGAITAPIVIEAPKAVHRYPDVKFTVVGHEQQLTPLLDKFNLSSHPSINLVHAEQVIEMDDKPGQSLRSKPESSMRVALQSLTDGNCQAMVSGGNTGALMTNAYFTLKTLLACCARR